jgi:hypothetical protein
MEVIFYYQDGQRINEGRIDIPVSAHPEFERRYLFAFPKSGSVMVNAIVSSLIGQAFTCEKP